MELRYMGFDQKLNRRAYRFEGVVRGEPTMHFVVTADLTLFLRYHVGIQEGPSLCAHKLNSDAQTPRQASIELTNEDLRAHADARAEADARKAEARRGAPRRRPAQA